MRVPAIAEIDDILEAARRDRLQKESPEQLAVWSRQLERVSKEERFPGAPFVKKRLAILSSFSAQHLARFLRLFLLQERIWAEVYEADFMAIESDILREDSKLPELDPDFSLIALDHEFLRDSPVAFASRETAESQARDESKKWETLWRKLHDRSGCHIIHHLYDLPSVSAVGNLDLRMPFTKRSFIPIVNNLLLESAPSYVTLLDYDYLKSLHGRRAWSRPRYRHLYREGISLEALGRYSRYVSRIIGSLTGRIRKCLVLDLDGTLWGGIVGEEGVGGIRVDADDPVGEAYLDFQRHVKRLKDYGVLLAVVSKNNLDTATLPFERFRDMPLKREDFACFIANWDDKATNLRRVARQLNIGLDAVVFFDDSPVERAWIEQELPEVAVVDVPEDPSAYGEALADSQYFEVSALTAEDAKRSEFYSQEEARKFSEASLSSYGDFLQSLEMKVTCEGVTAGNIDRIAQLISRTNQFNLRTERRTRGEIEQILLRNGVVSLAAKLDDRFGGYGVVSAVIAVPAEGSAVFIDTWVTSCRAFNRGLEDVVFAVLVGRVREKGYEYIIGEYRRTDRNDVVADLYQNLGFTKCEETDSGSVWRYSLEHQSPKPSSYHTIEMR